MSSISRPTGTSFPVISFNNIIQGVTGRIGSPHFLKFSPCFTHAFLPGSLVLKQDPHRIPYRSPTDPPWIPHRNPPPIFTQVKGPWSAGRLVRPATFPPPTIEESLMSNVRTDLPSSESDRGRSVPNVWKRTPAAPPVHYRAPDITKRQTLDMENDHQRPQRKRSSVKF